MGTLKHARWGAALVATAMLLGCSGADGKDGPTGPQGDAGPEGPQGDAGVVPPLQNDVSGTVTDGKNPLKDVVVTAGQATATTDASGAFKVPGLDVGTYLVKLHLAGYID